MVRLWDLRTGKTIKALTHHRKGIRSLVNHHDEFTFASAGSDKIRIWKQPEGDQLRTIENPTNEIINCMALSQDNVLVSGADNGELKFHDWKSGHCFQSIQSPLQPGSLSSESAIFDVKFDRSSLRMITAECDKTIKIWKEDEEAT
jgi:pleiotropic regulator 1